MPFRRVLVGRETLTASSSILKTWLLSRFIVEVTFPLPLNRNDIFCFPLASKFSFTCWSSKSYQYAIMSSYESLLLTQTHTHTNSPDLQNWNLTPGYSLVSNAGHFFARVLPICSGCNRRILGPASSARTMCVCIEYIYIYIYIYIYN